MKVYFSPWELGALGGNDTERPWAEKLGPVVQVAPGLFWQRGAGSILPERGDIVIISGNPRFLSSLALLVRARLRGAKTVWWGHFWSSTSRPWRHAIRTLLMRGSDALLFYTDAEVIEYLGRNKFKDRSRISALNNGVNIDPVKRVRALYRAADRKKGILFIGRVTEKACLELALDAIALCADPEVSLHIIGWGEKAPELQNHARRLGIEDRIHWHGGTSDDDIIGEVANRCRLFLYPGEVGLSLIHGMAYGLPALVHSERRKHMPEIAAFRDKQTGRLFRQGDAEDLSCLIGDLIGDEAALDQYSAASIREVESKFTTEKMVERFVALVDELEDRGVN